MAASAGGTRRRSRWQRPPPLPFPRRPTTPLPRHPRCRARRHPSPTDGAPRRCRRLAPEVLAPFLYIPVLAAAILGGYIPGLIMAGLASFVYAMALQDQSAAVGFSAFFGLLVDRATTYGVYALVAAFGSRYVERRLEKLE